MENNITLEDCKHLYERFKKYTETAEQHEFVKLLHLDLMIQHSLENWVDPIDQNEAQAMFRVVNKLTGV